jgi:hypothetical protein
VARLPRDGDGVLRLASRTLRTSTQSVEFEYQMVTVELDGVGLSAWNYPDMIGQFLGAGSETWMVLKLAWDLFRDVLKRFEHGTGQQVSKHCAVTRKRRVTARKELLSDVFDIL